MHPYPKIQTVFLRDPGTNHKTLLWGHWAKPEFEYLQHNQWILTEKVDGTNIRVLWDGSTITLKSREDGVVPPFLAQVIMSQLASVDFRAVFDYEIKPDVPICLYGEGYGGIEGGKSIQKGGWMYGKPGFILFDIWVNGYWLEWDNVEEIGAKLGIPVVDVIQPSRDLWTAIEWGKTGFFSVLGNRNAEGLVMRPLVNLFNHQGERVITKIKSKDFRSDK